MRQAYDRCCRPQGVQLGALWVLGHTLGRKSKKRSARRESLPGKRHTLELEKHEKVCPVGELAREKTYPEA